MNKREDLKYCLEVEFKCLVMGSWFDEEKETIFQGWTCSTHRPGQINFQVFFSHVDEFGEYYMRIGNGNEVVYQCNIATSNKEIAKLIRGCYPW
jgi:hypothetical protein